MRHKVKTYKNQHLQVELRPSITDTYPHPQKAVKRMIFKCNNNQPNKQVTQNHKHSDIHSIRVVGVEQGHNVR